MGSETDRSCAKPRVLVVDDEELDALGFQSELELRDLEVDVARNVEDARALLTHTRYTAVLVDIMLPATREATKHFVRNVHQHRQGIELCEALRQGDFEPEGTARDALVYYVTLIPHSIIFADTQETDPQWVFIKPTPAWNIAERMKLGIEKRTCSCEDPSPGK